MRTLGIRCNHLLAQTKQMLWIKNKQVKGEGHQLKEGKMTKTLWVLRNHPIRAKVLKFLREEIDISTKQEMLIGAMEDNKIIINCKRRRKKMIVQVGINQTLHKTEIINKVLEEAETKIVTLKLKKITLNKAKTDQNNNNN